MREPRQNETGVSRTSVLEVLRRQTEPMDIDQLAGEVGLTVNTVRFHLDHLIESGLVTSARASVRRPGRPKQLYRAMAAEAVDGAAAYRMLAGLLADQLVAAGDTQAPLAAGRQWADSLDLATPGSDDDGDPDPVARTVHRIVEHFREGGFAPAWDALRGTIALHRCPFMELATIRPEIVCGVHLGLVRGLLERLNSEASGREPSVPVVSGRQVRLRPVLDGSGPCELLLPAHSRSATG